MPAATTSRRKPSVHKTSAPPQASSRKRSALASSSAYQDLINQIREADLLSSSAEILSWDQETMMPPGGVEHRSRQLAQLAKLSHEMSTAARIGKLLAECERESSLRSDPLSIEAVNVREIRRRYDRKTRLPASLVAEQARLASVAQHAWVEARRESSFKKFLPYLEQVLKLLREKASAYGWKREPWDALAEDYEPGCTARDVERVFAPLRDRLQSLIRTLMSSKTKPSDKFNRIKLPLEQQQKFVRFVAESIGFDFNRGRLDTSTHPFCGGSHCGDVRLTTRFGPANVNDALGSTMHECGHGMYEQGLLAEHIGTPMGHSISLGIHESQSRMWENQVGRSLAFWKWMHPKLKGFFGSAVGGLSLQDVYGASNIVKPDFIRTEADEATYNLHIMVRFEIERALLAGELEAADVPGVWNAKYKEYLGLKVPDDRRGCLQDVHWSMTAMGYFPTYTLGNLYAAQLFEQAIEDIPNLYQQFSKGKFVALKEWLNRNIHAHGKRYQAAELCEVVTGKPLSAEPLMRHLEGKLLPLYGR